MPKANRYRKPDRVDRSEWKELLTNGLAELLQILVIVLVCTVLIMTFVCRTVTVSGSSMADTLQNNDRLLVSTWVSKPQMGDIVIVTHGQQYASPIIKRVIATEGQTVQIDYQSGEVSVDGVILQEDYIKGTTQKLLNATPLPLIVPKDYVFVMGDNREGSTDSRSTTIGLIPIQNIVGKAVFRFYPWDNFGAVR